MIGIAELFAEFSQPDEFHVAAQLELFAWREAKARRERQQWWRRRLWSSPSKKAERLAYQRAWRAKRRQDAAWVARQRENQQRWLTRRAA